LEKQVLIDSTNVIFFSDLMGLLIQYWINFMSAIKTARSPPASGQSTRGSAGAGTNRMPDPPPKGSSHLIPSVGAGVTYVKPDGGQRAILDRRSSLGRGIGYTRNEEMTDQF
jgi:hypothetical protein